MKPITEKLSALAATARIANVPSVAGNVSVGAFIALASGSTTAPQRFPIAAAAGICLYLAGNFLNDRVDRHWDARHRPERALPRGTFTPALYSWMAAAFSLSGIGLAAEANLQCLPVATAIVALILLYTAIHKRSAWSVIPMGLCRGLLPLFGFLACIDPARNTDTASLAWLAASGAALFCHVAGLSLSARHESASGTSIPWPACGLFLAAGCAAAAPAAWSLLVSRALGTPASPSTPLLATAAYVAWILLCHTRFRHPPARRVSMLLAGIPLVDCLAVLPFAGIMGTHHIALLWIPPLAFLAGLALQRLTPAT